MPSLSSRSQCSAPLRKSSGTIYSCDPHECDHGTSGASSSSCTTQFCTHSHGNMHHRHLTQYQYMHALVIQWLLHTPWHDRPLADGASSINLDQEARGATHRRLRWRLEWRLRIEWMQSDIRTGPGHGSGKTNPTSCSAIASQWCSSRQSWT